MSKRKAKAAGLHVLDDCWCGQIHESITYSFGRDFKEEVVTPAKQEGKKKT
jgi:hypothetical protein